MFVLLITLLPAGLRPVSHAHETGTPVRLIQEPGFGHFSSQPLNTDGPDLGRQRSSCANAEPEMASLRRCFPRAAETAAVFSASRLGVPGRWTRLGEQAIVQRANARFYSSN